MKAIFLDRDGTINIDKGYICSIREFEYKNNAIDGLRRFREKGFEIIIITNQSGIARGYYTEEQFIQFQEWFVTDLRDKGVDVLAYYYCPHHPDGVVQKYSIECRCRKPGLLLFENAIEKYRIDVKNSYVIGDRIRDIELTSKYPVHGILITGNPEEEMEAERRGIFQCKDLREASYLVCSK